jgi:hypothetical protein
VVRRDCKIYKSILAILKANGMVNFCLEATWLELVVKTDLDLFWLTMLSPGYLWLMILFEISLSMWAAGKHDSSTVVV